MRVMIFIKMGKNISAQEGYHKDYHFWYYLSVCIRMGIFLLNLERLVMIKTIRMIPIQGAFMPMTH